jgi:HEAT repeat protein
MGADIGTVLYVIASVGAGAVVLLLSGLRRASMEREWELAAKASGLSRGRDRTWVTPSTHRQPGLSVRFERWEEREEPDKGTQVSVESLHGSLVDLTLRAESGPAAADEGPAREIETGDEPFDRVFHVTGPMAAVRAVLTAPMRADLLSLRAEADLEVVGGELRAHIPWKPSPLARTEPLLLRTLPRLLEAAHALRPPSDLPDALATNALSDPEPSVRIGNLLALVREWPALEITASTLRAACADADEGVRVRAAIALGAAGSDVLLEVARRASAHDRPAARAIVALGDRLTSEEAASILARSLRARHPETARACLHHLAQSGQETVIPVLSRVLTVEHGELAVAAAEALALTGLSAAEPPLLAALGRDVAAVRQAAAAALGRIGTVEAVLRLREMETGDSDDATRRAARVAMAAIQSRLPGASPGQLSLSAEEGGTLSLAGEETGRLSLGPTAPGSPLAEPHARRPR